MGLEETADKVLVDFATPWAVAHQVSLSVGFSRQEYWSGLSFPSPEDLPDPGVEPMSPSVAGRFFSTELPGKPKTLASSGEIPVVRCHVCLNVIPRPAALQGTYLKCASWDPRSTESETEGVGYRNLYFKLPYREF